MRVKIIHGPTTAANGNAPSWFRLSVWTSQSHTGHGVSTVYQGKGLTSMEYGVVAESTVGNLEAGPKGLARELTMLRGCEGAEIRSRQVRNVLNVGPKSKNKVGRSMVQMKAASIPGIAVYSRPRQPIVHPRRTAFEQDPTLYYQFEKAFKTQGGGGSTLSAVQKAVNAAHATHGYIGLHMDATTSPAAFNATFSSLDRLVVADAAHQHAYWGVPASATDSTHNPSTEKTVLHTCMVQDLRDTTTMIAVGLSSGESTVTACWFRADFEQMVQSNVNSDFKLEGTYTVHDGAAALISAAIIHKQYTLSGPWHVFRLVMGELPKAKVCLQGLTAVQVANQG
jgi:hypothetical protein